MLITVLHSLFTPLNVVLMVAGVIIGIVFGAIPGLSNCTAQALLLPVSFAMAPDTAIIFMSSIFVGGVSGGLISAILMGPRPTSPPALTAIPWPGKAKPAGL